MHPQPVPVHNRRLLDQQPAPDAKLTITHEQLADALRRVMLARTPAILQGVWNVLQDGANQAALAAAQADADAAQCAVAVQRLQTEGLM